MEKLSYVKPSMEVVCLAAGDLICISAKGRNSDVEEEEEDYGESNSLWD